MPESADLVYKTADQIVGDVIAAWQARIPDMNLGPDAIARLWTEVFANTVEGLYLGQQLLHDDMFIQTANALALTRYGEMYGRQQKAGTFATGNVLLGGAPGAYVPTGVVVAAPRPSLDDVLLFTTTIDAQIPDPGIPAAPALADNGAGNLAAGTYEYVVTFLTAEGETDAGDISDPLILADLHQIAVTGIPLGGPGTTGRRLYRRVDGGDFGLVTTINDIVTVAYNDNIAAPAVILPPAESTAERVTVNAQANDVGTDFNVAIGTITDISDAQGADLSDVVNMVAFTGGGDPEDIETFRTELLKRVRSPQSGSPADLESWAVEIDGVTSATAFPNVNLAGAATPGTVVVRVAGPEGAVPDAATVTAVQDYLDSKDLANITIIVATFDPLNVNADVTLTLAGGYAIADVRPSVQAAIAAYINAVPVAGHVYRAGIYHAAFALPGVETLVVNAPAADVAAGATEKPVAGVITVN